jgi:hypothetical protein
MKYKQIPAAIHNFGHSFTGSANYVDGGYVMHDLVALHAQGQGIEIDWLTGQFSPANMTTPRLEKSIRHFCDHLPKHLASHNIDTKAIVQLRFLWPAGQRKRMVAVDDRGTEHKIYVRERK